MFVSILNEFQFYKYTNSLYANSSLIVLPALVEKNIKFLDSIPNRVRVITWVADKTGRNYLIEITPKEWNMVCNKELALRDFPKKELFYMNFSFSIFCEIKNIIKFVGTLSNSPEYTTIEVNGKTISIHWDEFYEIFLKVTPDTPYTGLREFKMKINDLFNAVQYYIRQPTKFSENKMNALMGLIKQGLDGEKLHLVFSELMGE